MWRTTHAKRGIAQWEVKANWPFQQRISPMFAPRWHRHPAVFAIKKEYFGNDCHRHLWYQKKLCRQSVSSAGRYYDTVTPSRHQKAYFGIQYHFHFWHQKEYFVIFNSRLAAMKTPSPQPWRLRSVSRQTTCTGWACPAHRTDSSTHSRRTTRI